MTIASTIHPPPEGNILEGVLGRIRYQNGGFLIAEVLTEFPVTTADGRTKTLKQARSIKGSCLAPQPGARYTFKGDWHDAGQWGWTFHFSEYEVARPTSLEAILEYVQAAKWIGPAVAAEIVNRYGAATLDILREEPNRVAHEVNTITLERAQEIAADLKFRQADEKILIGLNEIFSGTGMNKRQVSAVVEKWRHQALDVIKADPFALLEIHGIGFLTADAVRAKVGMAHDHPSRIRAGILHVLREAAWGEGHTYLPMSDFLARTAKVLAVTRGDIEARLEAMQEAEELAIDNNGLGVLRVAHASLWRAEDTIRQHVQAMLQWPREPLSEESLAALDMSGLADDQAAALRDSAGANVYIITGCPGVGKTFLVRRILDSIPHAHVELCAPTGNAAKRMYKQSGRMAQTIHRLLEPTRTATGTFVFSRNEENPVDADVVVVDESSMIDVTLMACLMRALRPSTRLILVGDVHQLPAVGPGNVLRDLIDSGVVPFTELTIIKRQDEGTLIVANCHRIKMGTDIVIDNATSRDFFFAYCNDEAAIPALIVDLVTNRLPAKAARDGITIDPLRDIQVISPLREKTETGCKTLNRAMRAALNPDAPAQGEGALKFAVGDKVIQTHNNYDLEIMNGDVGFVTQVGPKTYTVVFEDPQREVEIPTTKHDLELAYALTCHRFQGSEARVVVIPIHRCQGQLVMQRSWIYTAISRAREICVLVGQPAETAKIVRRQRQQRRWTNLKDFMRRIT